MPLLEIRAVFAAPLDDRQWAQVEFTHEALEVAIDGLGTVSDCEHGRDQMTITFDVDAGGLLQRANAEMRATIAQHLPMEHACSSRTDVGDGWSAWSSVF